MIASLRMPFPGQPVDGKVPDVWNVYIGLVPCPGISDIAGLKNGFDFDKKKPSGSNGAITTSRGKVPADFQIEVIVGHARRAPGYVERQSDWEALQTFVSEVMAVRTKNGIPQPYDVFHPTLPCHGIKRMFIESVDGPVREGKVIKATFHCMEWTPSPKPNATSTPKSSIADVPTAFDRTDPKSAGYRNPPAIPPPPPPPPSAAFVEKAFKDKFGV